MHLKNDLKSFDTLYNTISSYYCDAARRCIIFESEFSSEAVDSDYFVRFLLDRKHVVEYRIAKDRALFLSVISLAIGPCYFTPGDFWDYENSQRFSLEASSEAIVYNLELLDEFLRL